MARGQIRCKECWRVLKNLSGLARHKCKRPTEVRRRRARRQDTPRREREHYSRSGLSTRQGNDLQQTDMVIHENYIPVDCGERGFFQIFQPTIFEGEARENPTTDEPVDNILEADLQDEYAQDVVRVGYAATETSGTSGATRLIQFEEDGESGCSAGQIVAPDEIRPEETPTAIPRINEENPWWPFVSRYDWSLASWFSRARCSKHSIEEFFKDPEFAMIARERPGAIKTYNDLMRAVYAIPYGIPDGDQWYQQAFSVRSQVGGAKTQIHTVIFRPIQACLEFLLGHRPFASELVWAPVKKYYGSQETRVYDEMHTADWWWEKQSELPPGATIVPVFLSTDKTLMTQLRGDQSAWPVYMTIGNLKRSARRKQTSPASLLIGFLPISKEVTKSSDQDMAYEIKSALYHQSMSVILQPLENLAMTGWLVSCADGHVRHCYPIISNMLCDYEEVTLITGIKKNEQCGTCQAPSKKLQDLSTRWPLRTHEQMRRQMETQRSRKVDPTDQDWVHQIECFAWSHSFVNIHEAISIDMLHQLQKGVFRDLINWIQSLIQDLFPGQRVTKAKKKKDRTYRESPGAVQLDARFAVIPLYPGLKHFNHFSHIQQWTGNEERALIRILIPAIAPLLLPRAPSALAYARALVDFILLAQYRTHNDMTLRYMSQALFRIDNTKEAFAKYRPTNSNDEAHWNYPKFHALGHYVDFIKRYGAPNGFDTEHMEINHMHRLKDFWDRTNKNTEYLNQIASWNTRDTNRMAMDDCLLHYFGASLQEGAEIEAQVPSISKTPLKVQIFGCKSLPRDIQIKLRSLRLDLNTTTIAREAERATGLTGFTAALAVFVRACRAELAGEQVEDNPNNSCEADSTWVHDYPVQFYPSMRCWRRTGKDERDSEAEEPEFLRCSPNWRGKGPRNDFCWVQERPPNTLVNTPTSKQPTRPRPKQPQVHPLNGQLVGQLRALVKVIDTGHRVESPRDLPPGYCAALVDVYPLKNMGIPDPVHGMIEVFRARVPTVESPRVLKGRRFYPLPSVLRSAHIVPSSFETKAQASDVFYINNYIDWDQYQVLYEDDWEEKGYQRARKIKKQHDIAKQKAKEGKGPRA